MHEDPAQQIQLIPPFIMTNNAQSFNRNEQNLVMFSEDATGSNKEKTESVNKKYVERLMTKKDVLSRHFCTIY